MTTTTTPATANAGAEKTPRRPHWLRTPRSRLARRNPSLVLGIGIAMLGTIVLMTVFVPILSPYGISEVVGSPLASPSWAHPFGTDSIGRDVFVRTWAGGRNDLLMVVLIVGFSAGIGSTVGVLAATGSRVLDTILMRTTDAIISFPGMILVLGIAMFFQDMGPVGPLPRGAMPAVIAVIIINWASYTRLVRGEALSLRSRDFIKAAGFLGYSRWRIVLRHMFPNLATTIGTYMVVDAIVAVITIAGLPFIGAGIQPPEPEWGSLMLSGASVLATAWWVTILPGVVVVLYGVSLSLIADALLARVERGAR
jgi:peptide/nickel transport system permease protein